MQQYKSKFKDENVSQTFSNIQSCIRLNDLNEIDDDTHYLYFNMIGFFSFRQWTLKETIDFFLTFLKELNLTPDYVTIHPDKYEWKDYYSLPVVMDEECIWSDGEIRGYCTEFYINGIEIGNIVNTMGTCIDVGFGLERLDMICNGTVKTNTLNETILKIIEDGYSPSNTKQGYVLRKLLRLLWKRGDSLNHPYFLQEVKRQERIKKVYDRLLPKNLDKNKEWWYDTHGIDITDIEP
jgi:alanyl-tRNA synthetase